MREEITHSVKETHTLASLFFRKYGKRHMVIALRGDLGAGKTTFAQGLLSALGAEGPYTSPTFTIIKEYDVNEKEIAKVYHVDAYRVGSKDMQSLGWNEIIADSRAIVIIEWSENIADIVPDDAVVISCELISETDHKYVFSSNKK